MGKVKMHTRHRSRMRAFQVLYSLAFSPVESTEALQERFTEMPDPTDADMDMDAEVEATPHPVPTGYAWTLTEGVWAHSATLDATIEEFLHNWRLDRIGKIELTVLRLALYEILHQTDVPPRVVINEALELTGSFGDEKAKKFINGLLDAAIQKLVPPQTPHDIS